MMEERNDKVKNPLYRVAKYDYVIDSMLSSSVQNNYTPIKRRDGDIEQASIVHRNIWANAVK